MGTHTSVGTESSDDRARSASFMPLHRCAVLHELVVPDMNAARFPAQLVGIVFSRKTPRDLLTNSLRRRARAKSLTDQSSSSVPSLSPLTLAPNKQLAPLRAVDRIGRMHGIPASLSCWSPIGKRQPLAVGGARAYVMMQRQPSIPLRAELAMPKPSLLPLPPPARRLLPLGASRRSSSDDSQLLPKAPRMRPPKAPATKAAPK